MNQLTIFTIATGEYLSYWFKLIESSTKFLDKQLSVQWILLTDRKEEVLLNTSVTSDLNLHVIPIENLSWPLPTILRYEFIEKFKSSITGDYIMYLDADMLFIKQVTRNYLISKLSSQEIVFTIHPGFYRPSGFQLFQFYARNPIYLLKDLRRYIKFGALGTWERNKKSQAYVNRNSRSIYVCGGVWFGKAPSIINMCIQLGMTDIDNVLLKINNHHEKFMDNLEMEEFTPLDDFISDARRYLQRKKDKTCIDDEKHPFKQVTQSTLTSCEHLNKK